MKISTRLSVGFGLLILLFIICAATALQGLWQARDSMNDTVNSKMKRYDLVLDMRGSARDMAIAVRNLALLTDPAQMQPEWKRLNDQRELFIHNRELLEQSMASNVSEEGKAALKHIVAAEPAALSTLIEAGKLGLSNRQEETTTYLMNTARPAQKALLDALNELTEVQMKLSRDTLAENGENISRTALILMGLAVLSILLAVATCMITVRVLMRQLGGEPAQAQTLLTSVPRESK